jgi:hypothetical protein
LKDPSSEAVFGPTETRKIWRLLVRYGVTYGVRVAQPMSAGEVVFVVSTKAAANMNQRDLTVALTKLLGQKVWVTTDGPAWEGRTTALGETGPPL